VDGKYLLLKVTMDGKQRIFAYQQRHLLGLINIICGVRTENDRMRPSGPSGVFGVEGFELAETADGNVVLEVEFGAGGRLGFQFDRTRISIGVAERSEARRATTTVELAGRHRLRSAGYGPRTRPPA
jgi:hypothetical protein